jgi:hypothetical protein
MVTVELFIIHVTSLPGDVTDFEFYAVNKVAGQVILQISRRTHWIGACNRVVPHLPRFVRGGGPKMRGGGGGISEGIQGHIVRNLRIADTLTSVNTL